MKSTLLDLSKHADLKPFARAIADVLEQANTLEVSTLVTGAFARDLHLLYAHNIEVARQTNDIDIALAVSDWQTFDALKNRLIATGAFVDVRGAAQRLVHKSGLPIDLVPFGSIETRDRNIAWPPDGAFRMNLFGYQEAVAAVVPVRLPEGVDISRVARGVGAAKDRGLGRPPLSSATKRRLRFDAHCAELRVRRKPRPTVDRVPGLGG